MVTKRAIIQFAPGIEKIRISKPGVDVDSAGTLDLLLSENALYSQPYFAVFIACPFAGDTSNTNRDQTVDVTIPDVTDTPVVILYVADTDSSITFPCQKGTGGNISGSIYAINNFIVSYQIISSTVIRLRFIKSNSNKSPQGAYMTVMRNPDL